MAKIIMVQGTNSNAGKSLITAALCRIFKQDGYKVAPFKSQNMALNSYITSRGLEMGRAQVMQAEAAGIAPGVRMNPILLKPTGEKGSQVILMGEVYGNMPYFRNYKEEMKPHILGAFNSLSQEYDIIVIEGAGSPAEINLRKQDIANMGFAEMVNAPVLLVGDIDRGGVFASLAGTMFLLEEKDKSRIKASLINKFRGDVDILKPGIELFKEKVDLDIIGILPFLDIDIDDEDSLSESLNTTKKTSSINIAVIKLPRISNFTDFNVFSIIDGVSLRYVDSVKDLENPDLIILPGTKNTISDLKWLRESGLEKEIINNSKQGTLIIGICGGYQMLGNKIIDEDNVEGGGTIEGLNLINSTTTFNSEKTRTQAKGKTTKIKGLLSNLSDIEISGYEIHMGETLLENPDKYFSSIKILTKTSTKKLDGYIHNNIMGTYLHGIFDNIEFTKKLIEIISKDKGLNLILDKELDLFTYKEEQYDKLASSFRESVDMKKIYKIINGSQ
ncbi:MAG: cobyric acid synthase [Bacillota bacterium]|nr:cobyric acid synthase [Bacillota bacterium]